MYRCATILFLGSVLAASAVYGAEIWRWKDANGVVHYSDSPVPGAERIDVQVTPPASAATPPSFPEYSGSQQTAGPESDEYTRCEVQQPVNDATLQFSEPVNVSLVIEPALDARHRVQVLLNGTPHPTWPGAATSHSLGNMYRGSYTLAVRILDRDGNVLCSGPVSSFHVRQPSLLSPQRRPAQN